MILTIRVEYFDYLRETYNCIDADSLETPVLSDSLNSGKFKESNIATDTSGFIPSSRAYSESSSRSTKHLAKEISFNFIRTE